ncbi:MAG: hypothetical protein WC521_06535 [Bdellovibrionales bacterium]|jgi:hypothetical protein
MVSKVDPTRPIPKDSNLSRPEDGESVNIVKEFNERLAAYEALIKSHKYSHCADDLVFEERRNLAHFIEKIPDRITSVPPGLMEALNSIYSRGWGEKYNLYWYGAPVRTGDRYEPVYVSSYYSPLDYAINRIEREHQLHFKMLDIEKKMERSPHRPVVFAGQVATRFRTRVEKCFENIS